MRAKNGTQPDRIFLSAQSTISASVQEAFVAFGKGASTQGLPIAGCVVLVGCRVRYISASGWSWHCAATPKSPPGPPAEARCWPRQLSSLALLLQRF